MRLNVKGSDTMLPEDVQIISVDDHVIEHANVWADRLPAKYRDSGPTIVHGSDGGDYWTYEGKQAGNFALNAVAGKDPQDFGTDPGNYADMLPGCFQIEDRIRDMDIDGVWAQVCFPNMAGFAGRVFFESNDMALGEMCVQAYNDFILDEWCAFGPERQIAQVMVPFWDVPKSVAELERTIVRGARAFTFPEAPHRLGLPSFHTDHWDPLFALAQDAGLPVAMHFGSGGGAMGYSKDAPHVVSSAMMGMNSMSAVMDLVLSPVFHKFPRLNVVMAESGIGWVPYVLERVDYAWQRQRWVSDVNREVPPSQLFRSNIFACFIYDVHGIANRYEIGVDRILFESDYPHSDSNWPNTRERLGGLLKDVPDEETRLMVEDTSRRIYRFPRAS
jgi:predicted TIM-barrel fold metal-dependent hydrolase